MKKILSCVCTIILVISVSAICFAAEKNVMSLKVGDEVYACNCGEGCPCDTMSLNPGKCSCGNDMVKAKVTGISKGKAMLMAEGWTKERSFNTVGKYACNCSPECKCNTISQNPGKCTCGVEMKKF